MSRFPKPCLICGTLSLNNRCERHQAEADQQHELRRRQVKKQTGQYSGDYRRRAHIIRQTAVNCHICGDPARPNDPFEADHIQAATAGSELKPAHRSCNQRRGNKPLT